MRRDGAFLNVVCVVAAGIWPWLASFCAVRCLMKSWRTFLDQWVFIRLITSFVPNLRRNSQLEWEFSILWRQLYLYKHHDNRRWWQCQRLLHIENYTHDSSTSIWRSHPSRRYVRWGSGWQRKMPWNVIASTQMCETYSVSTQRVVFHFFEVVFRLVKLRW